MLPSNCTKRTTLAVLLEHLFYMVPCCKLKYKMFVIDSDRSSYIVGDLVD
jgi:hypothetical protein